jgi:hypothetical protein
MQLELTTKHSDCTIVLGELRLRRRDEQLPTKAQGYVILIEEATSVPAKWISRKRCDYSKIIIVKQLYEKYNVPVTKMGTFVLTCGKMCDAKSKAILSS